MTYGQGLCLLLSCNNENALDFVRLFLNICENKKLMTRLKFILHIKSKGFFHVF